MSFGDFLYIFAFVLFGLMTFLIVRNYFRSKFDDEGKRMDMKEDRTED
ncbi:MAG: hypothetical protein ABXS92_05960 [Sulfurimonas sp.]